MKGQSRSTLPVTTSSDDMSAATDKSTVAIVLLRTLVGSIGRRRDGQSVVSTLPTGVHIAADLVKWTATIGSVECRG